MSRRSLTLALVALLAGGGALAAPTMASANEVDRFGGDDAMRASVDLFLGKSEAFDGDTVVVTRLDGFADGLAATPLAAALKAPVLLTSSGAVNREVVDAVRERKVRQVVIVGGPSAVPASAEGAFAAVGAQVRRVAGQTRTQTATAVADEVRRLSGATRTPVFLATGLAFPDAVSAGAAAAKTGGVVVLSTGRSLDSVTSAYLRSDATGQVYAVGGDAAAAARLAGLPATLLAGADRYDTARRVADQAFPTTGQAVVTDGLTFGHSLAGSAYAARLGGPLLLTHPSSLPASTHTYLARTGAKVTAVGGQRRVADSVLGRIAALTPSSTPTTTPTPKPTSSPTSDVAAWEQDVFRRTNAERAKAGVPPLEWVPCLSDAARSWSQRMARPGAPFEHSPRDRGDACGHPLTGENIAYGYAGPAQVMNGWMNSPGHRGNILNARYQAMGVGIARSSSGTPYYTQVFSLGAG